MRYPQLLVVETDGRLAAALRPLADQRSWSLREPRRLGSVLRLLGRGGPNVLLIRAGRDLERELTLLDQARRDHPEARIVVVCDGDHGRLVGLAWDLGATCVLTPEQSRTRLAEVVGRLLGDAA